ncbi:hypothetical protein BGP77_07315 [Saccharospirillum sp. MSK14-1]|uniref:DUF2784 domain-containing protein n=1 Tax=Saccharospirillum sp. MSK14-1 TaxID=1897632 RepID=UPI000D357577|nr:DUF2784 domain-containing protein [Saccharospirillum sp. MSK14-1]PTY37081.1 hypothetical protein BGP77_07315 [Saccharospirillum sp. MSK14-1]
MVNLLLIWLANGVLMLHVFFVVFVVFGLVLIYLGYFLHWRWVYHRWLRIAHLAAIAIVVLQSWLGVVCPLTILEMKLRASAGLETYSGSFIQHWLQTLLYYSAPDWVFVLVYSVFGSLVLLSWWLVRPR